MVSVICCIKQYFIPKVFTASVRGENAFYPWIGNSHEQIMDEAAEHLEMVV